VNGNDLSIVEGKIPKDWAAVTIQVCSWFSLALAKANSLLSSLIFTSWKTPAKPQAANPDGETANCNFNFPDSYELHIGMGFDRAGATQLKTN